MVGVPKKDYSDKSGDVHIDDFALKDQSIIFPKKEYSASELAEIAGDISGKAAAIINQYRQVRNIPMCNQNFQIFKAANIRAKEVLTTYSHLRPDGTEGMDAPYAYGYPRWNTVNREVIGAYETVSTEWLKKDAAQAILDLFLKSVPDFLAGDDATEHAVGVYINFDGRKYHMGISYICAAVHPQPKPELKPEAQLQVAPKPQPQQRQKTELRQTPRSGSKQTPKPELKLKQKLQPSSAAKAPQESAGTAVHQDSSQPADKSKLIYAYNLSNFLNSEEYTFGSWTNFIVAKGDAKQVYKDRAATQRQVDNATIALNNAMDYLQKTIRHPKP